VPLLPESAHLREPRRIRLSLIDVPDDPVTVRAMLIPTFGDVIELRTVAGCRFYQPALARLATTRPRSGFPCLLIPEPANPYDHNAIAVWTRGGKCGFIRRTENPELIGPLQHLEATYACPIAVRGDLSAEAFGVGLTLEMPEELREPRGPSPSAQHSGPARRRSRTVPGPYYLLRESATGEIVVIARVCPPFFSEFLRKDGDGWEPDTQGVYLHRCFDSTDPWVPEDEARAIVESWGFSLDER